MKFKLLKIEKAILCGLLIAILASTVSGFTVFAKQYDDLRSSVLRLHILANSDSTADQQLKLNVRDKILEQSAELFKTASNKEEAEKNVSENLSEIQSIAAAEIKKEGFSYPVKVQLVNMYFDDRTYGNVTLPAGNYEAVRVTIGAAKGHNWWCVLFPPLCLPAAEKPGSKTISDVLSPGELCIVTNPNAPDIEIKLKSVEMIEQLNTFVKTKVSSISSNLKPNAKISPTPKKTVKK